MNGAIIRTSSKSLTGIQSLRGIAAMLVVAAHICLEIGKATSIDLSRLNILGGGGVDLFFVISGFIMMYVCQRGGKPIGAMDFLGRRIIRIYPIYWFYTCVILAMKALAIGYKSVGLSALYVTGSFLLVPAFRPDAISATIHPILDQGWTLSYEMYFYLLFAVWIWAGMKRWFVLAGLPVFFLSVIVGARMLGSDTSAFAHFLSKPIVFEFYFGVLIGWIFLKAKEPTDLMRNACLALGALGFLAILWHGKSGDWRVLTQGLPASFLVFGFAYLEVGKRLAGRMLTELGDISYSLYLVHGFFTMTLGLVLKKAHLPGMAIVALSLVTFGASVVAAWVSYRFLERPVTSWLTKRWQEKRSYSRSVDLATSGAKE